MDCNSIKKGLQHCWFPVKFAKFLLTPILKKICERQLLKLLKSFRFRSDHWQKTGENFIKCRYFSLYLHGCFHVFGILALDAIWKYVENVLKLTWQTSSFTTRRENERLERTIVNGGGLITTSLFQVNYLYYIKIRFLNYSSRKKYLSFAKLNYDIITLRHWNRYEWWWIYQVYTLKCTQEKSFHLKIASSKLS